MGQFVQKRDLNPRPSRRYRRNKQPPLSLLRSFVPFDLPVQETVEQKHSSFGTKYSKIQDTKKASLDGDASMNVQLKPFHRNLPCISCNSAQVSCCPAGTMSSLKNIGRIIGITTCFIFFIFLIPVTRCFWWGKVEHYFWIHQIIFEFILLITNWLCKI